jgi:hypothetical protein
VSGRLHFKERSSDFLTKRGCRIVDDVSEAEAEEQIRILCGQLSDERRRKLYRHLHALGLPDLRSRVNNDTSATHMVLE